MALSGLLVGCGPSNPSGPTHAVVSIPLPTGLFQRVEVLGERGTAAGQFNKPRSLTVDRQDNLYVVDSSFFPSSGAVNPSLTITAMAEYAMSQVPARA